MIVSSVISHLGKRHANLQIYPKCRLQTKQRLFMTPENHRGVAEDQFARCTEPSAGHFLGMGRMSVFIGQSYTWIWSNFRHAYMAVSLPESSYSSTCTLYSAWILWDSHTVFKARFNYLKDSLTLLRTGLVLKAVSKVQVCCLVIKNCNYPAR